MGKGVTGGVGVGVNTGTQAERRGVNRTTSNARCIFCLLISTRRTGWPCAYLHSHAAWGLLRLRLVEETPGIPRDAGPLPAGPLPAVATPSRVLLKTRPLHSHQPERVAALRGPLARRACCPTRSSYHTFGGLSIVEIHYFTLGIPTAPQPIGLAPTPLLPTARRALTCARCG